MRYNDSRSRSESGVYARAGSGESYAYPCRAPNASSMDVVAQRRFTAAAVAMETSDFEDASEMIFLLLKNLPSETLSSCFSSSFLRSGNVRQRCRVLAFADDAGHALAAGEKIKDQAARTSDIDFFRFTIEYDACEC